MPLVPKGSFSALASAYHQSSSAPAGSSGNSTTAAGGPNAATAAAASSYVSATIPYLSMQQHTLHSAAAAGNLTEARALLDSFAMEPTILAAALAQPLHGVLPLHAAASGGNERIVALFLSYGADVNGPLYRAAAFIPTGKGSLDLPRNSGSTIDANAANSASRSQLQDGSPSQPGEPGEEGSTALHFAAAAGHRDVIATLLQHGAKPDAKDSRGITPEMLAIAAGHNLCAEILRKAAAAPAIVPITPTKPSSIRDGPSISQQFGAGPSTLPHHRSGSQGNGVPPPPPLPFGSANFRKERTLSSTRRPPPIEVKEVMASNPPITSPIRSLKNQASFESIAANVKATLSNWNRTYSNSSNPFSNANNNAAPATTGGGPSRALGRHSSNPNLRNATALMAESSAGESLPGSSKAVSQGPAVRKSSKDRIKERLLKEPTRGKDKAKTSLGTSSSSRPAVPDANSMEYMADSPIHYIGANTRESTMMLGLGNGVQTDATVASEDSDGDESDLGFSVAATPPAPSSSQSFFAGSTSEAVPSLPPQYLSTTMSLVPADDGGGGGNRRLNATAAANATGPAAAGSPRMQALLLQGGGGPPPSPNRLAHRVVSKRSLPKILFGKLGSGQGQGQGLGQANAAIPPTPAVPPSPAVGTNSSSSIARRRSSSTVPESLRQQRSADSPDTRDKGRSTPTEQRSRSSAATRSRDRILADHHQQQHQQSSSGGGTAVVGGSASGSIRAVRGRTSDRELQVVDVVREAEDEVGELLSEENPQMRGGSGGAGGSGSGRVGGSGGPSGGAGSNSGHGPVPSGGARFSSSASNGSAGSSPRISLPVLSGISAMSMGGTPSASAPGSERGDFVPSTTGLLLSSPRSLIHRLNSGEGPALVTSPGPMTPSASAAANRKDRRPRASSAGSVARLTPLQHSSNGSPDGNGGDAISSTEVAMQIFKRADIFAQGSGSSTRDQSPAAGTISKSPALTASAVFNTKDDDSIRSELSGPLNTSGVAVAAEDVPATTSENGPAEEMNLADMLRIFGEALAREKELATLSKPSPALSTTSKRTSVVKTVSSEPKLSGGVTTSNKRRSVVKASPSNDTLPSVQISESDSPRLGQYEPLPPSRGGVGVPSTLMERSRSSSPVRAATTLDFYSPSTGIPTTPRSGRDYDDDYRADFSPNTPAAGRSKEDDRWMDRFRRTSGDAPPSSWMTRRRPSVSSNRSPESSAPSSMRMKLHGTHLLPSLPTTRTRSKSIPGLPKPHTRPIHPDSVPALPNSPTSPELPSAVSSPPPRPPDLRRLRTTSDANLSHERGGVGASPSQAGLTTNQRRKDGVLGFSGFKELKDLILLNKDRHHSSSSSSSKIHFGSSPSASNSRLPPVPTFDGQIPRRVSNDGVSAGQRY
ncbi:hypothetical protein OC846_002763 [Tilletia horrida]|uniref:Ankyrin n=1 Tax=Tilletia horrida TaxID=155126 RepID=A0AAN6JYL8_9BASI|nr:hypothetical protein OC845_001704 [Tilletia horrida]KAK0552812.1 hypothetical protein OC846_002763 [Tilletia horrida]KAK0567290.1 hypothetical protein OC861_002794 [Tilletia horrida]